MDTLHDSQLPVIYILSDSIGETGEIVVKAAISQFDGVNMKIHRKPYLKSAEQIELAIKEASENNGAVMYTLVRPDLKIVLESNAKALGVVHVDIMGPVVNALSAVSHLSPRNEPGLIRKIDKAYFAKIEAIEFAVNLMMAKNLVVYYRLTSSLLAYLDLPKLPYACI